MSANQQILSSIKPAGGNGLLSPCVAYYKMDEASGNLLDAKGSLNMTMTNGPIGSGTGIINGARSFDVTKTQYFTITNAAFSWGDTAFTYAVWVKTTDLSAYMQFVGNNGTGVEVWFSSSANRFKATTDSDVTSEVTASNVGAPSINTWYYIIVDYNPSGRVLRIKGNNGIANSTSSNLAPPTGQALTVGCSDSGFSWYGLIDEFAVFNTLLSDAQHTLLYNSGAGLPFSSFS